jgi:AraC-like DNA-binding protein
VRRFKGLLQVARSADGFGATAISDADYIVRRTADPGEAEFYIAQTYLPIRIELPPRVTDVDMELRALRVGSLTAGLLKLGRHTTVVSEVASNFHVNIPFRGSAVSRSGVNPRARTARGEAAVFPPEAPAEIRWSPDCSQLCLMVSRNALESELERLLGQSLPTPLTFDFHMPSTGPVRGLWRSALDLIRTELVAPSGLAKHPSVGLHVQGLLLDGLLLGHHHNYSTRVDRRAPPGRPTAIARAVELLESRPGDAWTVGGLAVEVHLSVRALHEGFARDVGMSPMTYLRHVRLHRAHAELQAADRGFTTVRTVATRLGILHVGRFAATYKATFGESPSETLGRPAC